jgi:hypothetical protein
MHLSPIFSNQRYKWATIVAGTLTLFYVLINIFVIGGDGFVITLNDTIVIPLAITVTILAYTLLNQGKASGNSRLLWGGLFFGWALWAIAEIVWAVYGYLGQEVPYPSVADFFWLIGYIPLGFGLYSRLREMPVKLNTGQKLALWGSSLATIAITITFVILPTLEGYDVTDKLGSIISIIYPLADLFLLIIALRLLFVYRSGDYGFGWNILISGFILMTIADLVYAYAAPLGLYYPDQKVNLISSLGNSVPYNLSYLVWIFGMYAVRLTLKAQRPFEINNVQPKLVPNVHILVFTKNDGSVIEVSKNFSLVFEFDKAKMKSFAGLLQIPEEVGQSVLDKIRGDEKAETQHIAVQNRYGVLQDVLVNGTAVSLPDGKFSGFNLMLRTLMDNDYTVDDKLDENQKSIISYLQQLSGNTEEPEIRKQLIDYYLAYIRQLYNLVFHTGGAHLGLVFLEYLQHTAEEHKWKFHFDPQTTQTNVDYPLVILRDELPTLLETAKRFASQLTDPSSVEIEMQLISSQFSEAVHRNVAYNSKKV